MTKQLKEKAEIQKSVILSLHLEEYCAANLACKERKLTLTWLSSESAFDLDGLLSLSFHPLPLSLVLFLTIPLSLSLLIPYLLYSFSSSYYTCLSIYFSIYLPTFSLNSCVYLCLPLSLCVSLSTSSYL